MIYFGVVAIVVAPVVEEILFRGILYPAIKELGRPRLALWGTAILFALSHENAMSLLPLTFLALVLTWLYERTDNLLAPIAAVQNRCNVLDTRDFESGLVERCRQLDIAYVPYSSVGGHSGHRRLAHSPALARVAEKHATSIYVIALAWLLAQGPHVVPIPGATKVASVRSSASAVAVALDAEDLEALRGVATRRAHADVSR
jgi:hypothetical protein